MTHEQVKKTVERLMNCSKFSFLQNKGYLIVSEIKTHLMVEDGFQQTAEYTLLNNCTKYKNIFPNQVQKVVDMIMSIQDERFIANVEELILSNTKY